jgi:hypothetical protein
MPERLQEPQASPLLAALAAPPLALGYDARRLAGLSDPRRSR